MFSSLFFRCVICVGHRNSLRPFGDIHDYVAEFFELFPSQYFREKVRGILMRADVNQFQNFFGVCGSMRSNGVVTRPN